jgi:exonuclease SbcD
LVTVDAGRIEAECIALDVVRWSQLSVPLDGVDRLESLNEAFARALEPVLAGDDGSAACGARDADGID